MPGPEICPKCQGKRSALFTSCYCPRCDNSPLEFKPDALFPRDHAIKLVSAGSGWFTDGILVRWAHADVADARFLSPDGRLTEDVTFPSQVASGYVATWVAILRLRK